MRKEGTHAGQRELWGVMDYPETLAYLETVLAHGPVGYGFVDCEFRFARVNSRLAELNGLAAEKHLGRAVSEVLGETLWSSRKPLFERALAGEDIVDVPLPGRRRPSGKQRHVLSSYYPVHTADKIAGIAVIVRDITPQTRVEQALKTREEEYRLLFEANPQPMWVYDIETLRFLAVNKAAVQVYGYSRAEFLAKTINDIRPLEDAPAVLEAVQMPRRRTRMDGPWRHLRKDGTQVWVEIAAGSLDFQGRPARLILALDVTERMAIEQERQQAAHRQQTFLRDVLASVTEGKLLLSNSPAQLPPPPAAALPPVPLTATDGLYTLRHAAREAAERAGHSRERQYDLIIAASEAGMNAIVHGGGGVGQVFIGPGGTVQVRIEDQGAGITMENLPRAALSRGFSTKATLGHGLKMMLETVDRISLLTGPTGTTVVLEQDLTPPIPAWL